MLPPLSSVCESKEKQESSFFSCETYIRIIVIDLIIVKLLRICPVVFPFKEKGFFHVKICILVCDSYFKLIVFVIILFKPNKWYQG